MFAINPHVISIVAMHLCLYREYLFGVARKLMFMLIYPHCPLPIQVLSFGVLFFVLSTFALFVSSVQGIFFFKIMRKQDKEKLEEKKALEKKVIEVEDAIDEIEGDKTEKIKNNE